MFLDQRGRWLEGLRSGLQATAYPIKMLLYTPVEAWHAMGEIFAQRSALQQENTLLKQRLVQLEIAAMRRADLEMETTRLQSLLESSADVAERMLIARIVAQEFSRQRRRITLDRGSRAGVEVGQTVVAEGGIVGQTMRVGPFSSEIILLTDPEHAIPVQVQRTGVRTIAIGTGRPDIINLSSLPLQTDIVQGDLLVTSGLGGIFPAGYPVAIVSRVIRSNSAQLAIVEAQTIARVGQVRHVALLWFQPEHAAAPIEVEEDS